MGLSTYNQQEIPSFMYGTAWKKDETQRLLEMAVESGFKAIDTANQLIHYNEAGVGDALLSLYKKGFKRESLFLQTKFTNTNGQDHRTPYDAYAPLSTQVRQSFESSLKHLHSDYLDSYVLHGPYSRHGLSEADFEVWAAIEEIYKSGKSKIIGVSNVSAGQLSELCRKAKTMPMLVQNRCYAITGWDHEVRSLCREHKIIYQGFSLLTANSQVLSHPYIQSIARRLSATPEQVIFKFSMLIGMLPLTGTSNPEHMKEDLAAERLDLTKQEVEKIEMIASAGKNV
ncbi:MAG: aldo/keto reductase [Candidatus Obscuribacterales bacterium]|nr:aldo/keto reductase [Candidatus Obscuribacterales bacterium]